MPRPNFPNQHFSSLFNIFPKLLHFPTPFNVHPNFPCPSRVVFSSFSIEKVKKKKHVAHLPYPAFSKDPGGPFHFPFSFSLSFLVPGALVESSSNTLKSSSPKASAIFRSWETQPPSYPQCSAITPTVTPSEASTVAHGRQK